MKRWMIFLLACLITAASSACSQGNRQGMQRMQGMEEPLYRDKEHDTRIGYVRNDTINGHEAAGGGGQNEIGYFKYRPQHYRNNGRAEGPDVFIDRPLLARHIAHLVTFLPNVKEATALVTDDHVFLGVSTKNGRMDPKTMREAKRTAESVTPRYYKVHVTSDKKLESEINAIGMRMTGNADVQGVRGDLEQLLRKMGDESPPDLNEANYPNNLRQVNPDMK
jgi:hypothetical protein